MFNNFQKFIQSCNKPEEWVLILYFSLILIDLFSSTFVLIKTQQWKHYKSRRIILSKISSIVVILFAFFVDVFLFMMKNDFDITNLADVNKPILFYNVVSWYCATEIGNIFLNLKKLGIKFPPFLTKEMKTLKDEQEKSQPDDGNKNN